MVPCWPTCADMFGNEVILLIFLGCAFNTSQCYTLEDEVRDFLEDNGCNYVSVVSTHHKTYILVEAIMKKTSQTLYTRVLNAGFLEYLDRGFNVFPMILKEDVVSKVIHDIGKTKAQHSLVVAAETWTDQDLDVFLKWIKEKNQDLLFYLIIPSQGHLGYWYQVLSLKSYLAINRVTFVTGSKLVKTQKFNLQGLKLRTIAGPAGIFASLSKCTFHETDVEKCEQLKGYFSDLMPLLERELNFTYDLYLDQDRGMGPVAGIFSSFLPVMSRYHIL